ncbi:MAG: glycerophosphodiester phosphodiesterase family protein [Gammaproteobacteria bacterium]
MRLKTFATLATLASIAATALPALAGPDVQLGPRPYYLIQDLPAGPLKDKLSACADGPFTARAFSIGHRGAALMFPEHTRESYVAAARMGAGILECDVTFTKDRELVCRHSQCDLHTTTNILATPLAARCSTPPDMGSDTPYKNVKCCTSDITLAEFKTLKGKMDAANADARTLDEYLNATAPWRTDLYASRGTLMSHAESIELFKELGVMMTPELKGPSVAMPYEGEYSQRDYARQMIEEYSRAGVSADRVWPQSFNVEDVRFWISEMPRFGKQAVYLDGRYNDPDFKHDVPATWKPGMEQLVADGVRIIAPPMWMLLAVEDGHIVPSSYAKAAKSAGLDIITWTLERSGPLASGGGWYYQTIKSATRRDSDMLVALDVLAREVGVLGVFSDWPATTSYYANCFDLR